MTRPTGESAAAATGHASPTVAMIIAGVVVLAMLVPLALAVRSHRRARRRLRSCPVCGGGAIRETTGEAITVFETRVVLQCGQCGTWRRMITSPDEQRAHGRRLERDQNRIRRDAACLEKHLRTLEFLAFADELRADIAGAEDFMARTRAARTRGVASE